MDMEYSELIIPLNFRARMRIKNIGDNQYEVDLFIQNS